MIAYEIALFSACISLFINYIIGKPGSEFSPYEIFSSYTIWLSKRRLKSLKLLTQYEKDFCTNMVDEPKYRKIEIKNDYKKVLYNAADPFFTWERAIGMCSICTGFWISLIVGFAFKLEFLDMLINVVLCHVIIRILNKIIS